MRSYERNGITIDQCTGCRGVFLDRGELEHLIDAESAFNTTRPAAAAAPRQESRPEYRDNNGYGQRRKKESFLGDLFDF